MKCAPAGMELSVQEWARWPALPVKAHEHMRIAGKLVDGDERIEVRNPYSGPVLATVAAASSAGGETKLTPLGAQRLVDILYEAACHRTCRWSRVAQAT